MSHLIVYVHGLHGEGSDFATFQTNCKFDEESKVYVELISKSNENMLTTHLGIDILGTRLKDEILTFLKENDNLIVNKIR